ncbi:uncharacterized protein LOC143218536 [Lasioglossum baleicum]|uniref:uncharacterized protein LOC143218536 n=1 Tax=Lasioglossum baleicum TaxID=434251 RepID=UPI003FCD8171
MEDERLIEAVRTREFLYDLRHAKYMDSKYKTTALEHIAVELQQPGQYSLYFNTSLFVIPTSVQRISPCRYFRIITQLSRQPLVKDILEPPLSRCLFDCCMAATQEPAVLLLPAPCLLAKTSHRLGAQIDVPGKFPSGNNLIVPSLIKSLRFDVASSPPSLLLPLPPTSTAMKFASASDRANNTIEHRFCDNSTCFLDNLVYRRMPHPKAVADSSLCKRSWQNIRDSFRKFRQRQITKSGQAANSSDRNHKYGAILEFLLPCFGERDTICSYRPNFSQPNTEDAMASTSSDPTTGTTFTIDPTTGTNFTSDPTTGTTESADGESDADEEVRRHPPTRVSKRKRTNNDDDGMLRNFEESNRLLRGVLDKEENHIELCGRSVTAAILSLDAKRQMIAKRKFYKFGRFVDSLLAEKLLEEEQNMNM